MYDSSFCICAGLAVGSKGMEILLESLLWIIQSQAKGQSPEGPINLNVRLVPILVLYNFC
jgi:hypothetical protein